MKAAAAKIMIPVISLKDLLPFGTFSGPGGIFGSMSGVGGRPIVALEGAITEHGNWKAIPFKYQTNPSASASMPSFSFPHFPRLDWTMWFLPLGSDGKAFWLGRLLRGVCEGR